jgi:hypothetical protein
MRFIQGEQRLNGLRPEELLAHLSPEQRLQGLSLAEIENYVKKQRAAHDKGGPELPESPS